MKCTVHWCYIYFYSLNLYQSSEVSEVIIVVENDVVSAVVAIPLIIGELYFEVDEDDKAAKKINEKNNPINERTKPVIAFPFPPARLFTTPTIEKIMPKRVKITLTPGNQNKHTAKIPKTSPAIANPLRRTG